MGMINAGARAFRMGRSQDREHDGHPTYACTEVPGHDCNGAPEPFFTMA